MVLTQSALSHYIKDLEGRLGCSLFLRKTRQVRFTSACNRLLQRLHSAELDLDRFAGGQSGRIIMAIQCHSCFEWLLPAIDAYRNEWSDVELDISSGFYFAPFPALARVDLDLVITADPLDKPVINYYLILSYEAQLAVAKTHPLVEDPGAEPRDLADEVVITYPVDPERLGLFGGFLEPAGVEPACVRHVKLTTVIVQLVACGRGVTCLPNWALHEYLQYHYVVVRSLGEEGVWPTLYAAARKD